MSHVRIPTGMTAFDAALGGETAVGLLEDGGPGLLSRYGLVRPSVTLVHGIPGVGKTFLLRGIAMHVANTRGRVLFVEMDGRGSYPEIKHPRVLMACALTIEDVGEAVQKTRPVLVLVDSLMALRLPKPRAPKAMRTAVLGLSSIAGKYDVSIVCTWHTAKSGEMLYEKTMRSAPDVIVQMASDPGFADRQFIVSKNIFGAAPVANTGT